MTRSLAEIESALQVSEDVVSVTGSRSDHYIPTTCPMDFDVAVLGTGLSESITAA